MAHSVCACADACCLLLLPLRAAQVGGAEVTRGGSVYRRGDRVLQAVNDYTKEVFNGDLVRPYSYYA